jgi:hypothetical protein
MHWILKAAHGGDGAPVTDVTDPAKVVESEPAPKN